MANVVQKITLASSRDIPFNKLVLSQSNVRRVKASVSIEELAESIARRGLIQGLHVRPLVDAQAEETGMFEVPAGGRRYRALELLVKQKRLAKSAPVPCVLGDVNSEIMTDEVSLAENIERAPLHPLDQFRAFQKMRGKGMTEEAIAAAFFVSTNVVKQRLRLASVSPALLAVYAEDGMALEQVMAFTISEDHARQEQVWDAIRGGYHKEPYAIRRMLTEKAVGTSDKRAVFVGIDVYEAAGGVVLRDLFQSDNGGWLQDVGLLDRLTAEKLRSIADEVGSEGWKWVEAAANIPYGATHSLRKLSGTPIDMTEEEQATRGALQAENDRLIREYDSVDELPEDVDQRLSELEAAIDELDNRPVYFEPAEMAIAGVFVTIHSDGSLAVDRGYVRPEGETQDEVEEGKAQSVVPDETEVDSTSGNPHTVVTIGGKLVQSDDEEDDGIRPLPDRLISELTAHRTLALRDAVARNPHVAMTALLHRLVSDTFLHRTSAGALEAKVGHVVFLAQADDVKDSPSAKSVTDRHEHWCAQVPADDNALWDWLAALDDADRMALLAHCVSFGVNALYEKPNPYSAIGVTERTLQVRLAQADRLARATSLDMVHAGWRPTVGNYLGRVTKLGILQAVREGAGDRAAQLIDHLKKDDMAREAERLLADTGWLPEPLRLVDAAVETVAELAGRHCGEEALPAFLSEDDGGDSEESDDEHAAMIAAE